VVITRKLVDETAMEPAGCRLFAANGTTINGVEEIILKAHVDDLTIATRFVASDNVTEPMLGVNWLRRNQIIWDFAKDLLNINGEVFSMIPESEEKASYRKKLLKEKQAEIEERKKEASESQEGESHAKRQKTNLTLPEQMIHRIRAVNLEEEACIGAHERERGLKRECESGDGCTFKDDTYVNGIFVNNNVLCDYNFSASKSKPSELVEYVYSCFVCKNVDPHSFNHASDLIRHSVSNHKLYPDKAKHNTVYLADGSDLREAKPHEIYRCGDGSHKPKKETTDAHWEEEKEVARTKAGEKSKKGEGSSMTKQPEEVIKKGENDAAKRKQLKKTRKKFETERKELTANLNKALQGSKGKQPAEKSREHERKNSEEMVDEPSKNPARRQKSAVVKMSGKELEKEIGSETKTLNDMNKEAFMKQIALKLLKMGPEVHAAYVKKGRERRKRGKCC